MKEKKILFIKKFDKIKISIFALLVLILTSLLLPLSQATPEDRLLISNLIDQVDSQNWYQIVTDLSENEDLDQPGHFFHSRYSLRVRDAQQMDGKPKPDHACDNAAEYIAAKFRSYGLEVEFDLFEHKRLSTNGKLIGVYTMRNVIATLPGKGANKDRYYLMTAHYDSIASRTEGWKENWQTLPAPGAEDNASGVAGILEAARILSQQEFDFTIKFVAFSGEELGLFGSKHFAKVAEEEGYPILGVINFDMIGYDADGILDLHVVGDQNSEWLVNAFRNANDLYDIQFDFHKVIDAEFIYSDHSPFWEIGVSAVMVGEESSFDSPEWPEFIHSGKDVLDNLVLAQGERAVKLTIATIAELADPITVTSIDEPNPDLAWSSDQFEIPEQVVRNQTILISALIENKVEVDVEDIEVEIVVLSPDGEMQVILDDKFELKANETYSVIEDFKLDHWGTYTIRAVVNPELTVFESDFSNNVVEQLIVVSDEQIALKDVIAYPNPFDSDATDGGLHLAYEMGRDAAVFVSVYSLLGELIREKELLMGQKGGQLGSNRDVPVWDGRNGQGELVAPGVYFCHVAIRDLDGNTDQKTVKIAVR